MSAAQNPRVVLQAAHGAGPILTLTDLPFELSEQGYFDVPMTSLPADTKTLRVVVVKR